MKRKTKEETNQENLILVSYYINNFGYPERKVLGRESSILNYVWVHTTCYKVKALTFPIILQGYLTQNIPEKDLREYFLQSSYRRRFEDSDHLTKPLGTIFTELELKVSKKININDLVMALDSCNDFLNMEKQVIGTWSTRNIVHKYVLNGKQIVHEKKGDKVMMFQLGDGRMFLSHIYSNTPFDPIELMFIDDGMKKFKEKNKVTSRYYQINSNGDLIYYFEDGKVRNEFFKNTE